MLYRFLLATLLLIGVPAAAAEPPVIAVLGDSLSAAYGLSAERGWVELLRQRLAARGYPHQVVNASISGDTTRGGLNRVDELLARRRPDILILELAGNDGLRGLPIAETRRNLTQIIQRAQAAGTRVLLVGVRLPPNYGPAFTRRFDAMFQELARAHRIPLVPFLLDGVALKPELMQPDRIHPTAEAQPIMLDLVWEQLEPMLKAAPVEAPGRH